MNPFIVPTTQVVPTLLIAFKDTFKAQLLKYIADEIPFKYQIITDSKIDIFDFLAQNPSDFLLIEDNFSNAGSIGFLKQLTRNNPKTKVIIYTENTEKNYLKVFLSSPAFGYIKKESTLEEFIHCLKNIFQGQKVIFSNICESQKMVIRNDKLDPSDFTEKEMEVWALLKQAKSYDQILDHLNIAQSTLKTHVNNMSKKLELPKGSRLSMLAIASK
jgi:two-component system, NarL family, response regulator, fimbrial Z protein, FimZ